MNSSRKIIPALFVVTGLLFPFSAGAANTALSVKLLRLNPAD
jgi:hypothetical protein